MLPTAAARHPLGAAAQADAATKGVSGQAPSCHASGSSFSSGTGEMFLEDYGSFLRDQLGAMDGAARQEEPVAAGSCLEVVPELTAGLSESEPCEELRCVLAACLAPAPKRTSRRHDEVALLGGAASEAAASTRTPTSASASARSSCTPSAAPPGSGRSSHDALASIPDAPPLVAASPAAALGRATVPAIGAQRLASVEPVDLENHSPQAAAVRRRMMGEAPALLPVLAVLDTTFCGSGSGPDQLWDTPVLACAAVRGGGKPRHWLCGTPDGGHEENGSKGGDHGGGCSFESAAAAVAAPAAERPAARQPRAKKHWLA